MQHCFAPEGLAQITFKTAWSSGHSYTRARRTMAATSWPEDTLGPATALATVGERLRLATLRFRDPPFQHSRPAKAQLPRRPSVRTRQGQCTPGLQVDVGDGVFLALQVLRTSPLPWFGLQIHLA